MSIMGFAIKQNGIIDVKTISPTEQAAWINWLLVECFLPVRADAPINLVRKAWERFAKERSATCIQVEIREMAP
jgi:hypothetical protein